MTTNPRPARRHPTARTCAEVRGLSRATMSNTPPEQDTLNIEVSYEKPEVRRAKPDADGNSRAETLIAASISVSVSSINPKARTVGAFSLVVPGDMLATLTPETSTALNRTSDLLAEIVGHLIAESGNINLTKPRNHQP